MNRRLRTKLLAIILPAVLVMSSLPAWAANGVAEDEEPYDARLAGYNAAGGLAPIIVKPASGTAGTWILTIALGVVCAGVLCKNGKRTHLD